MTEDQRRAVHDAVAQALGDAYDCTRVWSAWGCGTMREDDFSLVAEDDARVAEIADAAIVALRAAPPAPVSRAEPVAYVGYGGDGKPKTLLLKVDLPIGTSLYAKPVALKKADTEEEPSECHECHGKGSVDVTHEPLRDGYPETISQCCDTCQGTGKVAAQSAPNEPKDVSRAESDGGRNMFFEGLFEGESESERKRRLLWASDMRAAFERHFNQSWFDKDWSRETSTWAASWNACILAQSAPNEGGSEPVACAMTLTQLADRVEATTSSLPNGDWGKGYRQACKDVADGIRAASIAAPAPVASPAALTGAAQADEDDYDQGPVPAVEWDRFPGWLIDHHEGETITEELLQHALADMLKVHPAKARGSEGGGEPVAPFGWASPKQGNYFTRNKSIADRIGGLIPVYAAPAPVASPAALTLADAVAHIERKAEEYANRFGYGVAGTLCFDSQVKIDHYTSLTELADELRELAPQPSAKALTDLIREKLARFAECAEDDEDCDIGRGWFDALTTMGLLARTQRSPARWEMTGTGDALLAAAQPSEDKRDSELLDWLDSTNAPFRMGWRVGVAPAGNIHIGAVIQLGGSTTPIREAIAAAIAKGE